MFKIIQILFISVILISCNNNNLKKQDKGDQVNKDPIELYSQAMESLDEESYDKAISEFEFIINLYPLSNEGIQSEIMLGFIDYLKLNYFEAIYKFDRIIQLYPSHKNIEYAYYMKAMCYYEQIIHETLDGSNSQESIKYFNEIINRFPGSEYSNDSRQKIIAINETLAAKHMDIGFFYLKEKKYVSALNRYKLIITNFSTTKFTPEALYRLVEIYYSLGLKDDAEKTIAILSYNYPDSIWYEYTYNFDEDSKEKEKSKKINFLKKIIKKIKN